MQPLLLGLDIGTSACKVALFTPNGEIAAQHSAGYPLHRPQPGWAEQNPTVWWAAICSAIRDMLDESSINPARIAGIGVDGQSWSAIPIDASGSVLCDTPIWMDTRAGDICTELEELFGAQRLFDVSGNPLGPSYTLPKVLWYKRERPEVYEKANKILQSNGYIVYKLTGQITQDLSQGYGWQCFDMRKGAWDTALAAELGIRPSLLPDLFPCHAIVGRTTPEAANACGLPVGIPVVAGGLDAACGSLGAGVLQAGQTQEQGGQAGGMSICLDKYRADERLILSFHVVPNRYLLQGGTVGGGGALRWYEAQFGAAERMSAQQNGTHAFAELDALAASAPAGCEGLVFLPYLAGERSPIWDANAKGVYYGIDYTKTRAHFARATLEGVALSLRHNLEVAASAGAVADSLRAMGGAANSALWTQIKSDVTGLPIEVPDSDNATTLGAALLAGVAVGIYPDFDDAVKQTVHVRRSYIPNSINQSIYSKSYEIYRALYENLKDLMQKG